MELTTGALQALATLYNTIVWQGSDEILDQFHEVMHQITHDPNPMVHQDLLIQYFGCLPLPD